MEPVPESVVAHFSSLAPLPDDQKNVIELIAYLIENPYSGTPIPFARKEYKDCYVALTPDGKWRVVYRPVEPKGIHVLSIDPEES